MSSEIYLNLVKNKGFDIKGKEYLKILEKYYVGHIVLRNYLFRFHSNQCGRKIYFQVNESMNNSSTRERELAPIRKISDNYEK